MILTQESIDELGCDMPNCEHDHTIVYLYGACHAKAGISARYNKSTGYLTLACRKCEREIATVLVGHEGNGWVN